ncbi:MAG: YceI family protein, partial [Acidimicrobiales bacterium]
MSNKPSTEPSRSRTPMVAAGALAIVALLCVVGLWLFFRGDAPDDVSLEGAIESLEQTTDSEQVEPTESTETDTAQADANEDGSIAGTWTVDTESGDFDYESATGSFVGFRIEEELNSIGSTTAVGRTGDVAGTMIIDGSTVIDASIDIDMTTITTESSNRDDNVQDALETGDFPSASFVLTEPIELGDGAATGEAISAVAVGDMTVHGVTNQISFA